MSFNNTPESYIENEKAILAEVSYILRASCSCDNNSICDNCSLKMGEIKDTDCEEKRTICHYKSDLIKQTVDSSAEEEKQNLVADIHRDELVYRKNSDLCSLEEQHLFSQKDADDKLSKNNSNVFSCGCSCDFICDLHKNSSLTDKKDNDLCPIKENVYSHKEEQESDQKSGDPVFTSDTLEDALDAVTVETGFDSRRTRRNSKRKRDVEDCCPVCGVTIRFSELASHFAKEVENLSKISKSSKRARLDNYNGVNTTYVQVKTNRQNRHAAKVAKFSAKPRNEVHCPVCSLRLTGTQDEINSHVLNCINEDENYEEVNVVDSEGEDSFEEYEFADQRRVRAISLVPGGYRSLHGESRSRCTREENDEDLNVDVDDTLAYGNPQYTELDVIHNTSGDSDKDMDQLRKAVLLDSRAERHVLESNKWGSDNNVNVSSQDCCSSSETDKIEENADHDSSETEELSENIDDQKNLENKEADHIMSSLKERIKDLEEQNKNVKCLICLEAYTKPLVSTTCWHVHCEECWLMTMGVKKLCPQCNMIVFPSDLRRIYM